MLDIIGTIVVVLVSGALLFYAQSNLRSNSNSNEVKPKPTRDVLRTVHRDMLEQLLNEATRLNRFDVFDNVNIQRALDEHPEIRERLESLKKEQQIKNKNPYNKTSMSPQDAAMLVKVEQVFNNLEKNGPTQKIRQQATKVKELHFEFKNYVDAKNEPAMREKMTQITDETDYLMAMVTQHQINEGVIDEDDIPYQIRILMDKKLKERSTTQSTDKVQTMPTSDEELGVSLDFKMPKFGTFKMDDM